MGASDRHAGDFGDSRTDSLASLAFSPDGRTLAYQRGGGGTLEIWLSPVTGGTPVRLIAPIPLLRPYQDAPTWSPDGEWIAYLTNDAGDVRLDKARIRTGEVVQLLKDPIVFTRPAWSPDGKWIACSSEQGLVRVPSAGGQPVLITADPILAMAWRSDSRGLVALIESEVPGHFRPGRGERGQRRRPDCEPGSRIHSGGQSADPRFFVCPRPGIAHIAGQRALGHLAARWISATSRLAERTAATGTIANLVIW